MGICREPKILVWVSFILSLVLSSGADDPADNYLIDCGSQTNTTADGRVFVAEGFFSKVLSTPENVLATSGSNSSLYRTARIFKGPSTYKFPINQQGWHWIRLYFFPFTYQNYNLKTFKFSISTQDFVLLSDFQAEENTTTLFKEYLLNISSNTLDLRFIPASNSFAFVNALEVVSVPNNLLSDDASSIDPPATFQGLLNNAFETVYRINMGGPLVSPSADTLSRTWYPDQKFLLTKTLAKSVSFGGTLNYLKGGATQDTAPHQVYSTCAEMNSANVPNANFNMTWEFDVNPSFKYLLRFHFCDIVSNAISELYFNVYINEEIAIRTLDLSTVTGYTLAAPYFKDFVTEIADGSNKLRVSIGPTPVDGTSSNAILNGLEIMKLNNSVSSLDGFSPLSPSAQGGSKTNIGIIVGSVVGVFVAIMVAACLCLMRRRRKLKRKHQTKTWLPFSDTMGSKYSNGTFSTISILDAGGGLRFPLSMILETTDNFDEDRIIGVGGFGNVYKGVLKDGIKVAVKRGNPSSQQGLREFRTEIETLSNFRHRHLVALIGYCDERNEMILVYEYMENGTLKSHLYGSDCPSPSWKDRLQICIGAARGLHYLHTGSSKAVIHRDVKSANILLDENFMAKVADFGLSKAGPELDQTHVSTAVKGSFGYLDPEYFRRQQLTQKSDVYSFGVVLLEVICARPVIDPTLPREMVSLAEWGLKWQTKGQLHQIIDPRLAGQIRSESLRKFGDTIEKCLADFGVDRPSMGDVLWNLEYTLQLQEAVTGMEGEEDSSLNRLPAVSPRIEAVVNSEHDAAAESYQTDSIEDLSGVSMSRVFSQLVKSEGR
ncbi:receptor-like protein kinase HERK 1 [Aristolochia californica]|uniref:receptor-like protein kinase HERK 1 n=1 Tax=Aristolochia californica TaxID=171875 RepID=UPI0035DE7E6E